jgi:hypothetical protein
LIGSEGNGRDFAGLPILLLLSAVGLAVACNTSTKITGQVINAKTNEGVAGANVKVQFTRLDANHNWVDAGHTELTTGANGEFSTECPDMRARFVVLAQHEGFYPNYDCRPARLLQTTPLSMRFRLEVRLSPIVSPQPLPRGQGEVRFSPPGTRMGWNFATAQMSPDAASDFVGEPDEAGQKMVFLVARGQGGFFRAGGLSGEWALFNMPIAPQDGYQPRVDLREVGEDERATYFVRTSDGRRYAKIDVMGPSQSRDYCARRFYWVYQPNGSTALEIPLDQTPK